MITVASIRYMLNTPIFVVPAATLGRVAVREWQSAPQKAERRFLVEMSCFSCAKKLKRSAKKTTQLYVTGTEVMINTIGLKCPGECKSPRWDHHSLKTVFDSKGERIYEDEQ